MRGQAPRSRFDNSGFVQLSDEQDETVRIDHPGLSRSHGERMFDLAGLHFCSSQLVVQPVNVVRQQ